MVVVGWEEGGTQGEGAGALPFVLDTRLMLM